MLKLDEYDKLDVFLLSLDRFLQRKKAGLSYHYANYTNIIYCFKQLVTYNPFDKAEILRLKTEISALNPLTEREWLLDNVKNWIIWIAAD